MVRRDVTRARGSSRKGCSPSLPAPCGLRPDRAEVQEQWQPVPAATLRSGNSVFGGCRLVETFDQQASFIDRVCIGMERPVCADERHFKTIASDVVFIERLLEVRAANDEWAVHRVALEAAG